MTLAVNGNERGEKVVKEKIQKLWKLLWTREMIAYLIAGVLATVVNIVSYEICYQGLEIPNLISNAIAWVVSVAFAYYTNRNFVFQEKGHTLKEELGMMSKFLAARLFSFGVDELGMWILVDVLLVNSGLSKVVMNAIVVIMNYIFSKWFIFKGDKQSAV